MSSQKHDLAYYANQMKASAIEARSEFNVTMDQEVWIGQLLGLMFVVIVIVAFIAVAKTFSDG